MFVSLNLDTLNLSLYNFDAVQRFTVMLPVKIEQNRLDEYIKGNLKT